MDEKIRAAICRIDIMQSGACVSRGTGTLVAKGIVLTAFHVVGDRRSSSPAPYPGEIVVTFPSGATSGTLFLPHCDQRTDWALVQLASPPDIQPVPLAPECDSGAPWESYGWPDAEARDGMTQTGTVTNERGELEGNRVLQLFSDQAAAGAGEKVRGLSGGPVLVRNALAGVMRFALMTDGRTEAGTLYGVPVDIVVARCCADSPELLPMPDPCYGLPGLPATPLPEDPFRYLAQFTEKDAEIFFGRQAEIRQLYDMATAQDGNPLILLYGQSGVGKSSFLDAGLAPRLKWYHETRYARRDATRSLTDTLIAVVGGSSSSLGSAWAAAEQQAGRPLIVIFDQIEEVFTQPNHLEARELERFVDELVRAFGNPAAPLRGKLILSFRKEWYPEIQKLIESAGLAYLKLFLEAMGRNAVMDCVNGLTTTDRLRQKYGVRVEEALPLSIANDLIADAGSPVAPTLQILLTNLWSVATASNGHRPDFSLQLYLDLKRQGMLLGDFLDRQMEQLRKTMPAEVNSGLALDLLEFHTTPAMSVQQRTRKEIIAAYGEDRAATISTLIARCAELALLVDGGGDTTADAQSSRLSHDTLAPFVRARYVVATMPGPRARRILDGRSPEWNEVDPAPLEQWELNIVEAGTAGTRLFDAKQLRLIAAARVLLDREARRRRIIRITLAALTLGILAGLVVAIVLRQVAIGQRDLAQLYHDDSDILDALGTDPFLALANSVAVARRSLQSQKAVLSQLQNVLGQTVDQAREGYVYPGNSPIQAISMGGEKVVSARSNGTVGLHLPRGGETREITENSAGKSVTAICFSPDGAWFVTVDLAGYMKLWNRTGEFMRNLVTPAAPKPGSQVAAIVSLAVTPDSAFVVIGWSDGAMRVVPVFQSDESVQQETIRIPDLNGPRGITAVAAARNNKGETMIAAGDSSGKAAVWNLSGHKLVASWPAHKGPVTAIDLTTGNGPQLNMVTGSTDGLVNQWHTDGSQTHTPIQVRSPINAIRYDPSGRLLAIAAQNGNLYMMYVSGMSYRPAFRGFVSQVTCVAVDPEWLSMIAGSEDGSVRVVEMTGLSIGLQIPTDGTRVGSLVFRPPDSRLLAGSSVHKVYLWDFAREQPVRPISLRRTIDLKGNSGASLAIDPKGQWLAIANSGELQVWDLDRVTRLASYPMDCPEAESIAFNSDGSLLAVGGSCDTVDLFDTSKPVWSIIARIPARHKGNTRALIFSKADTFLFTTGDDSIIRRWPLSRNNLAAAGEGPGTIARDNQGIGVYSLALSATGEYLLAGDWAGMVTRLGNDGSVVRDRSRADMGPIQNIRVHPLGEAVYTTSDAGDLRIRSYRTGDPLLTLPFDGEAGGVFGLALSADGKTVASGNGEGFVKLWRAHWSDLAEVACERLKNHPRFLARQLEAADAGQILQEGADACASRFWDSSDAKVVFEFPAGK
jgi:WD40 repeat protein